MFYQIFNKTFQYLIFSFSIAKFVVLVEGIDNIDLDIWLNFPNLSGC